MTSGYDIAIIGGGINGAGIAADAARRGMKVALLESHDFAGATSSASSKLSHGGLRYLEQFEFRLVKEALGEREVLLHKAPHLVWPLRFALPVLGGMRPAWMLRVGLFLYDTLARRQSLPGAQAVTLNRTADHLGFERSIAKAFLYSDCWADDARLVIANLLDARDHGADIHGRTAFIRGHRETGVWHVDARGADDDRPLHFTAKVLVNAAGPWVESVSDHLGLTQRDYKIRRVKGSHIVTRKLYEGDHACMLQLGDGRVMFVLPYEDDFSLIGTTDVEVDGDPRAIAISDDETDYLLTALSGVFQKRVTRQDIVWSYAGVRPLYEAMTDNETNASKVTRDYAFRLDGTPPVLTVLGGKLTTYRKLADHALEALRGVFPQMPESDTASSVLPGGALGLGGQAGYAASLQRLHPWLPAATAKRFTRHYGSRAQALIADAKSWADMGQVFGADLTQREVDFLRSTEWAVTAEDILWRRTKLGLRLSGAEAAALGAYLAVSTQEPRHAVA